jgi:hypothetical protein
LVPQEARQHAEESLRIAKALLPENHLLLASSKRVLALILEEIAIDTQQVRYHSWICLTQNQAISQGFSSIIQSYQSVS